MSFKIEIQQIGIPFGIPLFYQYLIIFDSLKQKEDFINNSLKTKKPCLVCLNKAFSMWALRDLNPGPMDYESTALTN